ncbi:hypothetical protein Pelo_4147 [Pelomyxa schiedti]|nr:hypothetical protein Pelo_4147 [Pelomyxa schiedti]
MQTNAVLMIVAHSGFLGPRDLVCGLCACCRSLRASLLGCHAVWVAAVALADVSYPGAAFLAVGCDSIARTQGVLEARTCTCMRAAQHWLVMKSFCGIHTLVMQDDVRTPFNMRNKVRDQYLELTLENLRFSQSDCYQILARARLWENIANKPVERSLTWNISWTPGHVPGICVKIPNIPNSSTDYALKPIRSDPYVYLGSAASPYALQFQSYIPTIYLTLGIPHHLWLPHGALIALRVHNGSYCSAFSNLTTSTVLGVREVFSVERPSNTAHARPVHGGVGIIRLRCHNGNYLTAHSDSTVSFDRLCPEAQRSCTTPQDWHTRIISPQARYNDAMFPPRNNSESEFVFKSNCPATPNDYLTAAPPPLPHSTQGYKNSTSPHKKTPKQKKVWQMRLTVSIGKKDSFFVIPAN